MAQSATSEPATPLCHDEERRRVTTRYLSVEWIILVGSLILAWITLVPLTWIGCLLVANGRGASAAALGVICLASFGWNLFHLRRVLADLFQERGERAGQTPGRVRPLLLFGIQIVTAFACTHLAGPWNPIGLQQWFWMPISGFAGLILTRRSHLILALVLALVLSTLHEYAVRGFYPAIFWMFGQITTSVFIISCAFAATQASRQRLQITHLAAELRLMNSRLELQADQASVLAVAEERNRLAREIHDAVGHSLTVVGAQMEAAQALWTQSPQRALDCLQKAQRANREGLMEIRRSVSSMRATPPEQRTLAEALTALITAVEKPGMKLTLQQIGISRTLPALVEMSLYRCAQEGITNSCRHSGASEISVHLDFSSMASVGLSVADNGRGFKEIPANSHGLKGLGERAALLHGEFTAGTGPHGGGLCRMVVPV